MFMASRHVILADSIPHTIYLVSDLSYGIIKGLEIFSLSSAAINWHIFFRFIGGHLKTPFMPVLEIQSPTLLSAA